MRIRSLKRWILKRIEISTLITVLVVAGAIWAFVGLAGEVIEGDTTAFDTELLLSLRNPADLSDPIGPPWFESFARDITAFGGTGPLIMITVFCAGLLLTQAKRRSMLLTIGAIGSGFLVGQLLKFTFERPRPDLVPHGAYVYTASFPSGHSMMSAVVYLTLAILVARVQSRRRVRAYIIVCAGLLTICVGLSRVYLGVHWPTDVLAGWTIGAAWALMWAMIAKALETRGAVEPEEADPSEIERPTG